jgi:hypothetical protein
LVVLKQGNMGGMRLIDVKTSIAKEIQWAAAKKR